MSYHNNRVKHRDHLNSDEIMGFIVFIGLALLFVFLLVMSMADGIASDESWIGRVYAFFFS